MRLLKLSTLKILLPVLALLGLLYLFPMETSMAIAFFAVLGILVLKTSPNGGNITLNQWLYPNDYHQLPSGTPYQGVNPANGLPMADMGMDVAGNAYGADSSEGNLMQGPHNNFNDRFD